MAFENLSEQIKESFIGLKSRVTESETYNRFLEGYNNLPARQQRLAILLSALIIIAVLINIPLQSFLTSQSELQTYKDQKDLVQKLNIAQQLNNQVDFQPEAFTMARLEGDLFSRIGTLQVTRDQFRISSDTPDLLGVPKKAITSGYILNFTNLNVRQISKIANILENYSDSILVTGFKSKATQSNPHYFDTEFRLLNFSVPEEEEASPSSLGRPSGRPSFRRQ
jgi:hypothetical protein